MVGSTQALDPKSHTMCMAVGEDNISFQGVHALSHSYDELSGLKYLPSFVAGRFFQLHWHNCLKTLSEQINTKKKQVQTHRQLLIAPHLGLWDDFWGMSSSSGSCKGPFILILRLRASHRDRRDDFCKPSQPDRSLIWRVCLRVLSLHKHGGDVGGEDVNHRNRGQAP
jgi:hypothetical protein